MEYPNLIIVNGYLWPAEDTECRAVTFQSATELARVYPLVKDFSVAVQAGGNTGVWPSLMIGRFQTVYTFEPDPVNFFCLARNCPEFNIIKFQAGLGAGVGTPRELHRQRGNCGAHQIAGPGNIPLIALDSLNLQSCGLIYLDIEGFEAQALAGATKTIELCRPIIGIENKGLSETYGISREEVHQQVLKLGYRQVDAFARDVIYAPC